MANETAAAAAPTALGSAQTAGAGKWMALLAAFLGWMFDGLEMGLFPLVGKPALRDLLGPTGDVDGWFSIMIAVFLIGAATGGVVFGWLGDRIGRVRAMTLSVLAYTLFTGLCGLANSAILVAVFRFIASLGMGGEWALGVALVMEIWPAKSRATLAGLIGAAANVGFVTIAFAGLALGQIVNQMHSGMLSAGIPVGTVEWLTGHSGWRLLMIVGALPALLTFFIRLAVPESERWLHEQQKGSTSNWATSDLLAVVIGAVGSILIIILWGPWSRLDTGLRVAGTVVGLLIALVGYIFPVVRYLQRSQAEGRSDLHAGNTLRRMLFGALISGICLIGTWGAVQFAPSWAHELSAGQPEIQSTVRAYTQIWSGIGAIIGTMLGAWAGDLIGRRPTYALLCLLSFASAFALFKMTAGINAFFFAMMFLTGATTAAFYGWIPLYLPELFPTRVRATGQGFSYNFGRILAAIGALQTGALINLFKGPATSGESTSSMSAYPSACITICLVYFVGLLVIWLGPETRGKPLPE